MPHLPFASNTDARKDDMQDVGIENEVPKRRNSVLERGFGRIQRFGHWFKDDDPPPAAVPPTTVELQQQQQQGLQHEQEPQPQQQQQLQPPEELDKHTDQLPTRRPSLLARRGYKGVVPGLPRPLTFRRQNSEKRDRLLPVQPTLHERRAVSADRRPSAGRDRHGSPPLTPQPSLSAPEVCTPIRRPASSLLPDPNDDLALDDTDWPEPLPHELPNGPSLEDSPLSYREDTPSPLLNQRELQAELETKWILNLSMHFRDGSHREKFFVTYAREPNKWRRVTISLDYRDAEPKSLEAELKTLHYQRDKSACIYEAVRESLNDIQFFDTVTNLKLETDDARLHVHVTEDVNEVISYPSISLIEHIQCPRYRESYLDFEAHLSGFVYRVRVNDQVLIKKEIPGPDTVDEFLYEVNALDALQDSKSVIKFHGLVIDDEGTLVKGLLISFAARGSLIDLLYDYKGTNQIPWERREQWAFQIIRGLSEIHEAGFVQGDFTLSNIVIDGDDDAKIIDINRRGCPVGWEPPELLSLIRSGQRITLCIGVKSDLFQLGMVLWALAEKNDEPENTERIGGRLPPVADKETPLWFKGIVEVCLSENPRDRASAKELLDRFPVSPWTEMLDNGDLKTSQVSDHSMRSRRSNKQYIDPEAAVRLEDIEEYRRGRSPAPPSHLTSEQYTLADPAPSTKKYYSEGSFTILNREKSPALRVHRPLSSATSISSTSAPGRNRTRRSRRYPSPDKEGAESRTSFEPVLAPDHVHPGEPLEDLQSSIGQDGGVAIPAAKSTRFACDLGISQEATWGSEEREGMHELGKQEDTYFTRPHHQDSGFDEQMISTIESLQNIDDMQPILDNGVKIELHPNTAQPNPLTTSPCHFELLTQTDHFISATRPQASQPAPEPLTPFAYYTPLTSPIERVEDRVQRPPSNFGLETTKSTSAEDKAAVAPHDCDSSL